MRKFEYKIVDRNSFPETLKKYSNEDIISNLERSCYWISEVILEEYGKEGWELVCVGESDFKQTTISTLYNDVRIRPESTVFYFKREKHE
jgi:hypothetical protein